jgi:hypothetical protein
LISDVKRIESVQRRFTKSINYLHTSSYPERLINLCVDSLQCRRVKADLIFCYKLLHGQIDVQTDDFVVLANSINLRGNRYKLAKSIITTTVSSHLSGGSVVRRFICPGVHLSGL